MKQFSGYIKNNLTNSNVLLAEGGDKPLSSFLGTLDFDMETRTLRYHSAAGELEWTNVVQLGARAMDDTSYLPLAGGTMSLGEGLKFHADENYFGTNLDARIISLLDGNDTTCDGGLIIDERATKNGVETVTELLRIRDNEFKWRGTSISLDGHRHAYTTLTGSTTTADLAIVSSGTTDGWTLKTLGSRAFDSTAYLPLTGGTLTGTGADILTINRTASDYTWIRFYHKNNLVGYLGVNSSSQPCFNTNGTTYGLWHDGNDGTGSGLDADLLDGKHSTEFANKYSGSISANKAVRITFNATYNALIFCRASNGDGFLYLIGSGYGKNTARNKWCLLSNNSGGIFKWSVPATDDYSNTIEISSTVAATVFVIVGNNAVPTFTAIDALTTTGINNPIAGLNDNVASATKLQTARTLWGQSFDGTANVDGLITVSGIGGSAIQQKKGSRLVFSIGSGSSSTDEGTEYGILSLYHGTTEKIRLYTHASSSSWINCYRLGIGTSSPSHLLHVNGTLGVHGATTLSSTLDVSGKTTLSGDNFGTLLTIQRNSTTGDAVIEYKGSNAVYGYIGIRADKSPVFYSGTDTSGSGFKIWYEGNDGTGSGLDADLLDGNLATAFSNSLEFYDSGTTSANSVTVPHALLNKDTPTTSWWHVTTNFYSTLSPSNCFLIAGSYNATSPSMYIRLVRSGTPTDWKYVVTEANIGSQSVNYATSAGTSAKVTLTKTHSNTEYPILFGSSYTTSNDDQIIRTTGVSTTTADNPLRINPGTNVAANTEGNAYIVIGNNLAKTVANNRTGSIYLFGSTAYWGRLVPTAVTGNRTYTLPNNTGTVALTSDIPTNFDSLYVLSVSISGNNLRITKNGSNTDLTIPYATKAALDSAGIPITNYAQYTSGFTPNDGSAQWYTICTYTNLYMSKTATFQITTRRTSATFILDFYNTNSPYLTCLSFSGSPTTSIASFTGGIRVIASGNNAIIQALFYATTGTGENRYCSIKINCARPEYWVLPENLVYDATSYDSFLLNTTIYRYCITTYSLMPIAANTYDIGSSTVGYRYIYAGSYYTTSDKNKKENIKLFSEHISKFTLKETNKDAYGVIAQEVPEMFRDGEEGNMTVNYNSVLSYYIGLLENRVKELEEKINKLENYGKNT